MIDKRPTLLVIALALAAAAAAVWAQQSNQIPVIGMLMVTAGPTDGPARGFKKGLGQLGYVDGENIRIEYRSAEGRPERLATLARELVDLKVDVIVTGTEPAARALQQSTANIPIVAVLSDHDPVASGLVDSLSRPGRNLTGVVSRQSELVGKRLELLKEALPKLSRVAVLWDSFSQRQFDELQQVARSLGIQLQIIQLLNPYDIKAAFRSAKQREAGAVVVLFSPVFYRERAQIATLALDAGLPTMNQEESWVTAGGFISYGATIADTFGRAAYFVDRLLKGAKAADLPVEQATGFKLTVNLKTAKALRLSVPESIVLRADDVIR